MNADAASRAAPAAVAGLPRRRLALDLVRCGRKAEAAELVRAVLDEEADGRRWIVDEIVASMEDRNLTVAGDLAAVLAGIERGSEWAPRWTGGRTRPVPGANLSLGKLRHDVAQLRHLRALGSCDAPLGEIIQQYEDAIEKLSGLGPNARASLTPADEGSVGRAFGRLIHVADASRVWRALSPSWDRQGTERAYLDSRPNVVTIDDFLTEEALWSLVTFCQESTIWAGNRYANGRLSALFFTGFNAPIVLQIAEEIREAFPTLIGDRHPLRQLWAFKNTEFLPAGSTIHADFAAVNVNLWITPEDANLDPASGGMVVYDLEAPLSWNFRQYNEHPELIRDLIARHRPNAIRIPYRQNRAIIFNSDLFHATEAVCFRPDYLGNRINVTMLYGDRTMDEHHAEPKPVHRESPMPGSWRSAAFVRRKR
jgi:hypothetical protein